MILFFVGLGLFVVGATLNPIGWRLHGRRIAGPSDGFQKWLLEVVRHWFTLLTDEESDVGQRLAAFGAIITAVGIVAMAAGIIAWSK